MSSFNLTFSDISKYCALSGWKLKSTGMAGELWLNSAEKFITIPFIPPPNEFPYQEQVSRIAEFEMRKIEDVMFRIKYPNMDVTRVRGASDIYIAETIPLKAGLGLIGSTYKMLRASATTARMVKGHIGNGFLSLSDQTVAQARLGQTEIGSYIVPILMPLSDNNEDFSNDEQLEIASEFRDKFEPFERRVMRTFAQSLQALDTIVTGPGVIPNGDAIIHLISVGVSREFVNAINDILAEGSVSSFDATFDWAPIMSQPTGVPEKVSIASGAQEFLVATAKKLQARREFPNQSYSGHVVFVEYFPNDPDGTIGVQVMRNKRSTVLLVHLNDKQMHDAMKWMDSSRTVIVAGKVEQNPGKHPRILQPTRFNALDQDYLSNDESFI